MEQSSEYREQLLESYKQAVRPLLPYLPWLEQSAGKRASSIYSGQDIGVNSVSFPVYDGTLLNFVREATKSPLMDRNYAYVYPEIEAPDEYSLLASPIKVVLNRKGNSILVDNQDVSRKLQGDTITIQVADQKKFNLPATGSWSRLILGFSGGILIGLAVIIYLLQKRRKEGKAS